MLAFAFVSCKKSQRPNVENINLSVEVVRFDKDIFSENNISVLKEKYGSFFNNYCEFVIGVGSPDSANFLQNLNRFRSDSIVRLAENKASAILDSGFQNVLNSELTLAFKYFKYYFPADSLPQIYIYTSGFNQSLILDQNVIGIGMDKFLGSNEKIYSQLGFSKYLRQNMRKEMIVANVAVTLAIDKFPLENAHYLLIEKMIYEGKILYFKKHICPDLSKLDLFGFSNEQLEFCRNNEAQMWRTLVENKYLYSDNFGMISRFTEDAPFTSEFTQDSPGKAANWIGYNIVEKYMENSKSTLSQLMRNKDFERILREAKYSPK
jgi:hypothetical protein